MASVPAPTDWYVGQPLTAARMNTELRDAVRFLLGLGVNARPRCRVRQSSTQSLAAGAWTPVALQTEDYDTDTMHSSADAFLTATTAGLYAIVAACSFASVTVAAGAAVGVRAIRLETSTDGTAWTPVPGKCGTADVVNGATAKATGTVDLALTRHVYLTAGQKLRMVAWNGYSAALNTAIGADSCPLLEAIWMSS